MKSARQKNTAILSADDIQDLLEDPNSWLSKLYAECQLEAEISKEAFYHYVAAVIAELKIAEANERAAEREAQARADDPRYYQPQHIHHNAQEALLLSMPELLESPLLTLSPLTVLKVQLTSLLNFSQEKMDPTQLAVHRSNVMTNFNNQISAKLGPTIQLQINGQSITLKVPQYSSKPVDPIGSSVYAPSYNSDQLEQQRNFADHKTLAELGPIASLTKLQDIRKENGDEMEEGVDYRSFLDFNIVALRKMIDFKVKEVTDENPGLSQHLLDNNAYRIKLIAEKSQAERPGIFSIKNGPAFEQKKSREVEEDERLRNNGGYSR